VHLVKRNIGKNIDLKGDRMKNHRMAAKPLDRYGGKLRPFLLLSPDEDKAISHTAIDADLTKNEWLRRAALYCLKNKIDLSDKK